MFVAQKSEAKNVTTISSVCRKSSFRFTHLPILIVEYGRWRAGSVLYGEAKGQEGQIGKWEAGTSDDGG